MSKVDDKDFVKELYGIMESEGPGTTLPQAISKFVDIHAHAFVATMAQRYEDKTYDDLQESLRDRRLLRTVSKIEAIKSCLRYENETIAEIMIYDAKKAIDKARRRAEDASHEGKIYECRTRKHNSQEG